MSVHGVLVTLSRPTGYQTGRQGARVPTRVLHRPKGLQAIQIIGMDKRTAGAAVGLPQQEASAGATATGWQRTMVKWFNRARGFGFPTRGDGSPDTMVQLDTLHRSGLGELEPGQMVEVETGKGGRGPVATATRIAGGIGDPTTDPSADDGWRATASCKATTAAGRARRPPRAKPIPDT
jgi:CspA family cold shock protein